MNDDDCVNCGERVGRPNVNYYVHVATGLVMCADGRHAAYPNYPYESDREVEDAHE